MPGDKDTVIKAGAVTTRDIIKVMEETKATGKIVLSVHQDSMMK